MLLPPGRREFSVRNTICRTIQRASNTFGAMVEYHPISTRDQAILQFGKKVLPGNELVAGSIWNGDVLMADMGDLEKFDASEIYLRRTTPKKY